MDALKRFGSPVIIYPCANICVFQVPAFSGSSLNSGDDDDIEEEDDRHYSKRWKRSKSKHRESSLDESEEGSDIDSLRLRTKKRGRKDRDGRSPKKSRKSFNESDDEEESNNDKHKPLKKRRERSVSPQDHTIYRAITEERMSVGWSQSPCGICPSFEFCKDDGPVNPKECIYYGDWLTGAVVADIEDNT
jgi:DNA-directed RNA polymerase III subunit RPC6